MENVLAGGNFWVTTLLAWSPLKKDSEGEIWGR